MSRPAKPATPPLVVAKHGPIASEPFQPVALTPIRTTSDIAAVLVEIRNVTGIIRTQMLADANTSTELALEMEDVTVINDLTTRATFANAVVMLADCVAALAQVNA